MDIFDQYIFDELVSEYSKPDISDDDYEELYIRFSNISNLEEAKPYILVMRYLGQGTEADESALSELAKIDEDDVELQGLVADLKLVKNPNNTSAIVDLRRYVEDGYTGKYLNGKTNIDRVKESTPREKSSPAPQNASAVVDYGIHYKSMTFEGCGYSGLYFTSGDIDYLNARVFIEPMKGTRHVTVRSQIYDGDEPFSKVFTDEFTLKTGDTWFTTTGWGNKNCNCYGNRVYQWRIEIDGKDIYCQDFRFYSGKIDKYGMPIKEVKLFASKSSGAVDGDWDRTAVSFDANRLDYVYFKLIFNPLGADKNIQAFIKVDCLEDGTEFYNKYSLFHIESDWCNAWTGIGPGKGEKWKRGLYKYTIKIGSNSYEGTFTIF